MTDPWSADFDDLRVFALAMQNKLELSVCLSVCPWCCSSRTSRSWWITQSTQHHRRGCNRIILVTWPILPFQWVHLMANNSSSGSASDGKINTALLHFRNAKRLCLFRLMMLCLFCLMRLFCLMTLCLFCLTRLFCLMRQNKIHGCVWADQDWIGLMIFKNFEDQDWIGFNFCGSGLD